MGVKTLSGIQNLVISTILNKATKALKSLSLTESHWDLESYRLQLKIKIVN